VSVTNARLEQLIHQTHVRGVNLIAEIARLEKLRPRGWKVRVALKRRILRGLKALNKKRWHELASRGGAFSMYDTTDPNARLPTSTPRAVAGYVGGHWPSFRGLVARYPHAKHLSIAVNASEDAQCLDVETGDATPGQAPTWVRRQHKLGVARPVVYANTSTMPSVIAALTRAGIKRDEYLVWTAHYTDIEHIEPGSDATQWRNVETPGANYDVSRCQPWFL
jgi:hypothetical protein